MLSFSHDLQSRADRLLSRPNPFLDWQADVYSNRSARGEEMAYVMFRVGDLFERGGDLTVLPCSAKSHISSTAEAHVQKWGLSLPPEIPLGKIDISPFPHKKRITHYIAWAASVMNYKSS